MFTTALIHLSTDSSFSFTENAQEALFSLTLSFLSLTSPQKWFPLLDTNFILNKSVLKMPRPILNKTTFVKFSLFSLWCFSLLESYQARLQQEGCYLPQ